MALAQLFPLTATCRGDRIVLTWQLPSWLNAEEVVSYDIYRSINPSPSSDFSLLSTIDNSAYRGQLLYDDYSINPNTVYYYYLKINYSENQHVTSQLVFSSTCATPPFIGPVDIAFIVDNTHSMESSFDNLRSQIISVLDAIVSASANDYRLALVTPDNDSVNVRLNFAIANRNAFETALQSAPLVDGYNDQESTDECLNTVVNTLSAFGRNQTGDFSVDFRSNARKIVVLITDSTPGGFGQDDMYDPIVDPQNAHAYALDAQSKCVKIDAIQVYGIPEAGPIMQDYAATSCGWYEATDQIGSSINDAVLQAIYTDGMCQCQ
jgi:hypothetical protein